MTVVRSAANPATVLFSFSSFAMHASPIKLVPVPVREAKPALEGQQYGETLAAVAPRKPGKLRGMRAARFFPIPAPSLTRDGWRGAAVLFTGFALVLLVAVVDSFLGGAYRLGLLYLVPIAFASWMSGRLAGLTVMALALGCWYSVRGDALETGLAGALLFVLVTLIARLREALQQADERFTAAMESLNDPVYVEDARTRQVLFANRRYAEAFGSDRPRFNESGEAQNGTADRWFVLRSNPPVLERPSRRHAVRAFRRHGGAARARAARQAPRRGTPHRASDRAR